MQVNGEQVTLETPVSVADYLEAHGFRAERVAIELNGEIIPRDKRADAMLDDQCVMEILIRLLKHLLRRLRCRRSPPSPIRSAPPRRFSRWKTSR